MFSKKILDRVEKFMLFHQLFPPKNSRCVLAISAGRDSCVLASLINLLSKKYQFTLAYAYFHHNTRAGQDIEESFVRSKAIEDNAIFYSEKWDHGEVGNVISNFESKASKARHEFLRKTLLACQGSWIYTAHHLQDSFEWSLIQLFGTSSPNPLKLMAPKNGSLARPLLELTSEEIKRYGLENSIPFIQDPTNNNDYFLRNYLRIHLIPLIEKKFPQYLKHYRVRAMENTVEESSFEGNKEIHQNSYLIENFSTKSSSDLFSILKVMGDKASDRGPFQEQWQFMKNGVKNKKIGPYYFSSKVLFFYIPSLDWVYGFSKNFYEAKLNNLEYFILGFENNDNKLDLNNFENKQSLYDFYRKFHFPMLFFNKNIASNTKFLGCPSYRSVHPIYPKITQYLVDKKIWFQLGYNVLKTFNTSKDIRVSFFHPCRIN